jgi:hypothetical protein
MQVQREAFTLLEGFRSDVDEDAFDDLVNAYMDLDGLDLLNTSEDHHDDHDSCASGARESIENDANSQSMSAEWMDGEKSQHCRSLSMDSFMGKHNLATGDESPKMPLPSPSVGLAQTGNGSLQGGTVALFDMEFANGEFTEAETKKILANEHLAKIAFTDPKRIKRCAFLSTFVPSP